MAVVYLMSTLRLTATTLPAQFRFPGRRAQTSGTTLSRSRVTMRASLWALPAVSNCSSGFHAKTIKPVSCARG
jgi:hypothetical protein